MKRLLSVLLVVLLFTVGCSKTGGKQLTPEEMTTLYKTAIEGARTAQENEGTPVITTADDEMAEMVFPLIGFKPEYAQAYAISVSPWNISAYGIAVITPKEDQKQAVLDGLNAFVENQRKAFENYLPEGYENAKNAKVTTLDDGTVILVMCPNQDDILKKITDTIAGNK